MIFKFLKAPYEANDEEMRYIYDVLSYQFSPSLSDCIFIKHNKFLIQRSINTDKIRDILTLDRKLFLVLRAQDNLFSITEASGNDIKECSKPPSFRVMIQKEISEFILQGKNVFCKFVVDADPMIRYGDEVLVVDEDDRLLAIGRAKVSGEEIKQYKKGLAVIVKRVVK
ncbi:PUA domain-containing protein [Sulfolobus acidocaldarius]|uniref:Conserved Archaeal PUA domain protein n=4 Tax=Sulfolobus acidocaldarius TaxID=2285 RepID=Q4JAY8_SULAC|nr:PUA domain-containing protein [Sulfolobus acidocaldarius]AAY80041.1 conserved Archaeal PUA domain protein [Sulfolobus acidocaldarius DSM 639]AGE70612.1 PUA domain containing protein [Sulfolobus acidocaldarius N8]AGE72885.1 PUA domain containing protein [Sulfolobus acidocaldarius Ron12/I]ALU29035.1 pseudouridine synthase [Sulfolobus acidocaldarius]ALU31761.1 pseudouridine synthase [Sulfolobus acidocaldarius]